MAAVMYTGAKAMHTTKVSPHPHLDVDELTDLHHESSKAPWIVMHDDSSSVAYHLGDASKCAQDTESPLLPAIRLVDVDKQADAKDCDEEGVGRQAGLVLEDALLDAACFERAVPDTSLRVLGRHDLERVCSMAGFSIERTDVIDLVGRDEDE